MEGSGRERKQGEKGQPVAATESVAKAEAVDAAVAAAASPALAR